MDTTDENDEFVKLSVLIKRDNIASSVEVYQAQAEKNNKTCDLVYIGKYTQTPVEHILNFDHDDLQCDLMSFSMDRDEIINQKNHNQYFRLIAFLIQKDEKIIGSLEYIFEPNKKVTLKKPKRSVFKIAGKFKIIFNTKITGVYKTTIIKECEEYSGREESIYLLTSILIEDNVINEIK